ncbi:uncharacterized protein LOC130549071 isoform X2 [Triplophysa rosa]|uniref:uncharacterized protein LOC130549071 isoform X2 n=1 Tax=Triplophysa rosa TaxID=992332 RepID=UPI0025463174|nr:uncharacterized protein LOC130549071 isoform X2 [Triplophysa rosa]
MEGHSVTLHTDVTHIQTHDEIEWRFKHIRIARIKRSLNINPIVDDDEIFRDRLKMNNQTGDLTITHITSQHSGLYSLEILTGDIKRVKTFSLTVNELDKHEIHQGHDEVDVYTPGGRTQSVHMVVISCAVVGPVMIVSALLIFFICRKHTNKQQQDQIHEKQNIYADSTFYKHNAQRLDMTEVVYTSIKQDQTPTNVQLKYIRKVQYYVRVNKT